MVASNQVRVTLSNAKGEKLPYVITAADNQLANDWLEALDNVLANNLHLNKSFCFLGFPHSSRDLHYLCDIMNKAIHTINCYNWSQHGLAPVRIEEHFSVDAVRFGPEYQAPDVLDPGMFYLSVKHEIMNRIHGYFERLQGTVEHTSEYAEVAPLHIREAIGKLNTICHEIESLILSQRKHVLMPEWTRPCQITTFAKAPRYLLKDEHRKLFLENGFDRHFGGVYMHWAQIGKTYFEVFRDEQAPVLTETVCKAITQLKYYSGEFDVEWGKTIVDGVFYWHDKQMQEFKIWLEDNGIDSADANNSIGYLPIGQIDVKGAFGTEDPMAVWDILSGFLNIHSIETAHHYCEYPYTWRDEDA